MAKGIKPVTAYGFHGMNNLPREPADMLDRERKITPRVIVNAEPSDGGKITPRGGFKSQAGLPGIHSLAGNERGLSVLLGVGVADNILYRIDGTSLMSLTAIAGPRAQMSYAEINNLIYISNPYWNGVYDLLTGVVRPWGLSLPNAPNLSLVAGDMPPGAYTLAYTRSEYGQLSGNGPLSQVSWQGGTQGILLNNLDGDLQVWITQPNGQQLFLANLDGDMITGQVPQMVPLPSFTAGSPPPMADFCQAFGRIWGCAGNRLVRSEPFQYEWFRQDGFIPFLEELVMVAPVTTGLFVASRQSTWYLDGTEPEKMTSKRFGDGVVPGSMVQALMPAAMAGGAATSQVFAATSRIPTPVWQDANGFVVGSHGGNLVYLTEHRLKMTPRDHGASLFRTQNGIPQIITTMHGLPVKAEMDDEIDLIVNQGGLF